MGFRKLAQVLVGSLLLCTLLNAADAHKKVLVLVQEASYKESYSIFFDSLAAYGLTLDIKGYKDSGLRLKEYDDYLYDHLAIFAPKAEGFGGNIDINGIVEFIDSGRSVLIASSNGMSQTINTLAAEVGVDFDDKGTKLFDHVNFVELNGQADHNLVAAADIIRSTAILGKDIQAPILYKGAAASVAGNAELVTVALTAPLTAYSHDSKKPMAEPPTLLAGSSASLVSLVQARNNARVLVSGSIEMFSNAFIEAEVKLPATGKTFPKSGNRDFTVAIARWAFQDSGVLRAEALRHHIIGSDEQPTLYRVNDEVEFLVDIYEYEGDKKQPYKADDVQMEFVMLDPYQRLPLKHNGKGTFSVRFKVPDVYGVFKYVIDYKHQGYSYIQMTHQVPVRPFKHNEYERFLLCAYPYYASAASSMAAFFIIGFFYLYHK